MNEQLSGLRPSQRDVLRLAGAVVFAAGVFVLFLRKEADWAAFPLLLVLGIPCVLLYGLGIGALRFGPGDEDRGGADGLSAWRATALVLGIILVTLTLAQLIDTIGGDPNKPGWVFVITLVSAGAAAYAAMAHRLRFGVLLAGLFLIVSWISLWDAIVDPSATAVRWLLIVIAVALAAAAWMLHGEGRREAPEIVTASGVAAVAAGVTALISLAGAAVSFSVSSAFGTEPDLASGAQQGDEWNVFLLVVSVALVWYGAKATWRGPAYVGAIGLFAFVIAAALDISSLAQGEEPGTGVVGWPLLLLLLGGAALAAGLLGGGGTGARPAAETAPTAPTQTLPPQDPPPPSAPPPASAP